MSAVENALWAVFAVGAVLFVVGVAGIARSRITHAKDGAR